MNGIFFFWFRVALLIDSDIPRYGNEGRCARPFLHTGSYKSLLNGFDYRFQITLVSWTTGEQNTTTAIEDGGVRTMTMVI